MSDRKDLAWARLMGLLLLHPISRVIKSELPLCGARCRDGHACRAKAAWDGIEPYNGRCRDPWGLIDAARGPKRAGTGYPPEEGNEVKACRWSSATAAPFKVVSTAMATPFRAE